MLMSHSGTYRPQNYYDFFANDNDNNNDNNDMTCPITLPLYNYHLVHVHAVNIYIASRI